MRWNVCGEALDFPTQRMTETGREKREISLARNWSDAITCKGGPRRRLRDQWLRVRGTTSCGPVARRRPRQDQQARICIWQVTSSWPDVIEDDPIRWTRARPVWKGVGPATGGARPDSRARRLSPRRALVTGDRCSYLSLAASVSCSAFGTPGVSCSDATDGTDRSSRRQRQR